VTFYAAVQGSWILGALLETEFFPRRPLDRGVHDSILKLLHYVVITLGFLLSLSLLGFELKNFVVLAGALGIGIGFGLQHIVNNFVSGLLLLFERPVKVGDMIMIESEWCTVRKIGLRATTVETFDQSEIIVPNSDLISQKVTNLTLSSEQSRVVVQVGAAYGSNVQKVLELLTACAAEHPRVLKDPPPSPLFVAFGESSLNFELRAWVAKTDYRFQVKSDLLSSIDNKFREAGIEIPFPQRDLHLRSLDITTLKKLFDEHSVKDTERH
jgi:small-conductance mechanosensitive channel